MSHPTELPGTTATIRFLNNTAARAALLANGNPLFGDVEAGRVTPWREVEAHAVTFTLGAAGDGPFVTQRIEEGAHYTVTARAAPQSEATLRIVREAESASAIGER
jgi:hypothetical protein